MEQLQAAIAAAVTTALQAKNEGQAGGGKKRQRVISEKDFRRIDKFDGNEVNWKSFEFDFRIAMKAVSPKVVEVMDKVGLTNNIVTGEQMEDHDSLEYEGMTERGAELFEVLCLLTSGGAKLMIKEAQDNDGFAAWQILLRTFGRKTLASSLRKFREAVNPKQAKDVSDIVGAITRWESAVKELERTEQEKIPEMIKLAALTEICTSDVRDMIYQNVDTNKNYDGMREKVVSWVSNRVASGVPMDLGKVEPQGEDEWTVDAVTPATQCYRCGGWGHMASKCATPAGKAKGKGQEKGGEKGKGKGWRNFEGGKSVGKGGGKAQGKGAGGKGYQGTCWNCGKVGHKSAECWYGRAAAAVEDVGGQGGVEEEEDTRGVDSVWMIASVEEAEWKTPKRTGKPSGQAVEPRRPKVEVSNAWQALAVVGEEEAQRGTNTADMAQTWRNVGSPSAPIWRRSGTNTASCKCCPGAVPAPPAAPSDLAKPDRVVCEARRKERRQCCPGATPAPLAAPPGPAKPDQAVCEVDIASVERRRTKITVDSGAGVSVWPVAWGCPGRSLPRSSTVKLEAANGTPIETYGERLVKFGMEGVKDKAGMKFLMTDVKKPLAAVSAIVEAGNEVVFRPGVWDSFILNPRTGEKVPLKRERGTYTLEVEVDESDFSGRA